MDDRLYTGDLASTAAPIGIFDSGVGGLTVLRELHRQLPYESILYFGDTARLPYGTRTASEINQFVQEILAWMIAQGAKMVLMACNTSSALALEAAQADCPIPVLGVILPGARAAVKTGRRIGVIATAATANSHAYRHAITEIDSQAQVWEVACPEFVPLIEQNRIHDPHTRTVAARYLEPLLAQNIDTLIYGCTHYPHLAPVLKALLPPSVTRLDPAAYLAAATARELDLLGLRATSHRRPTIFTVSGDPSHFSPLAAQWLGQPVEVQQVSLTNKNPSMGSPEQVSPVSALNLSQRESR